MCSRCAHSLSLLVLAHMGMSCLGAAHALSATSDAICAQTPFGRPCSAAAGVLVLVPFPLFVRRSLWTSTSTQARSYTSLSGPLSVRACKEWFVAESWRGQHVGHDVWITQATYQRVSQSAHQLPIVCPASCPVATPLHNSVLRKQTWVALRYHAHVRYTRLHEIGSPVHVQITIHEIAQH
ncbi:hypothetical protein OH76DRAFT_1255342 [Lentinus brumalis]|uniref:Secreted protein n=1 Tax=Lentinus brumalis TaxID=2498619 RepID=A0A371CRJ5_9APHY|nr:hypothetical protein OH76DRAFT_1255342 [Polyporus brumalis]